MISKNYSSKALSEPSLIVPSAKNGQSTEAAQQGFNPIKLNPGCGRLVMLVTNIPTPYRIPLFNELGRQLRAQGRDFHVIFAAAGYARRQWKIDLSDCAFPYTILAPRARTLSGGRGVFLYPGLSKLLKARQPEVVITSGFGAATLKIWAASWFRNVTYIIWSGAVKFDGMRESRGCGWLRSLLIRRAAGCVAYGSDAQQYLRLCGAPPEKISIAINTVDVSFFARQADAARLLGGEVPTSKRVLYVGELSPRKGVDQVLRIAARVIPRHADVIFDIVGTGSEEARLKEMVKQLNVSENVVFHGFRQKAEVAELLGRARCFLFCTNFDIWGLVLVEAMAAGLPCIASVRAGSTRDLIREGRTGFAADFSRTDEVSERLCWLLDHPREAVQIGERARKWIADEVSLARSAEGFTDAIHRATKIKC